MTKRTRHYDVRIVVDRTVLNDILTYAEDHGEVISISPHTNDLLQPKLKRTPVSHRGLVNRTPGFRIRDEVYAFVAANPGCNSKAVFNHIGSMNSWKPQSASPALSELKAHGYLAFDYDSKTYTVTSKKLSSTGKKPDVT